MINKTKHTETVLISIYYLVKIFKTSKKLKTKAAKTFINNTLCFSLKFMFLPNICCLTGVDSISLSGTGIFFR